MSPRNEILTLRIYINAKLRLNADCVIHTWNDSPYTWNDSECLN